MRPAFLSIAATFAFMMSGCSSVQSSGIPLHEVARVSLGDWINGLAWDATGERLAALSGFGSTIDIYSSKIEHQAQCKTHAGNAYPGPWFAFPSPEFVLAPAERMSSTALIAWDWHRCVAAIRFPSQKPSVGILPNEIGPGSVFTASLSGSWIAASSGRIPGVLMIFDGRSGRIKFVIPQTLPGRDYGHPVSLAFRSDEKELAVGYSQGAVEFYDVATGAFLRRFTAYPTHDIAVSALVYSPNGTKIATGRGKTINLWRNNQVSVDIWDSVDGNFSAQLDGTMVPLGKYMETTHVWSLAWGALGDRLVIGDEVSLRVWGSASTKPKLSLSKSIDAPGVYSVAISPQGYLAIGAGKSIILFK